MHENDTEKKHAPVPYEEWLFGATAAVAGYEGSDPSEAEENLLDALEPLPEGTPDGYPGTPAYVSYDYDLEGRAALLVDQLLGLCWRHHEGWQAGMRPRIFADSNARSWAEAVALYTDPRTGARLVAFELELDLPGLACRTPEELRALHERLVSSVGCPLTGPAKASTAPPNRRSA